ncbi:hypothetical protein SUGI_1194030 [Cryptomeria japonica]|nr:hypothetical protein SUGI_1194030 [Cryptomeria japonica]
MVSHWDIDEKHTETARYGAQYKFFEYDYYLDGYFLKTSDGTGRKPQSHFYHWLRSIEKKFGNALLISIWASIRRVD